MIAEALKYPFQDEKWIKKIVIGSILVVASLFIIPALTLLGYLLRVMRDDSLPGFDNVGQMTLDGLKATGVAIVYLIIPVSLIVTEVDALVGIGFLLYVLVGYLIHSAFYQLSNNGWKAAFSKKVLDNAFSINYLGALVASGVISFAIFTAYFFTLFLVIPIILLPVVYLYQYIFTFRLFKLAIESE